ncbi:DNA polymerase III subunit gamma/tau [Spirochaetia bacterium 38H-sp]|uniref:DNA polymerase III subunit gamma/tau n=1 Tax=Rarispira pelagica TaxID=3141764 RepID=A0ABU9U936_9SPIR
MFEVTANRKRPQAFSQLVGQEFVVSTLSNALSEGRIAHAYLFSGPRGVGKTSAARILARALNCEKGITPEPCGVCDSCREILTGSSIDVIEIDGASNTSVNDVRVIRDEVLFAPSKARYKVYIIDEVHMLSNSAFNALLKTIEEPPPYVVFIFATTELQRVPATIRSRCQQYHFRLVSYEQIVSLLASVCREIGVEAEDEALMWIAKESGGSLRDAYTLFDQVVSFCDKKISFSIIKEKLGLAGFDSIQSLVACCSRGDTASALSSLDGILSAGISVEQCVIDIVDYLRALLFVKGGVKRDSLLGYSFSRFDSSVVDSFSLFQIEKAIEIFLSVYRDIRYSVNQRYELELAVARLSHVSSWLSPEELAKRLERVRAAIASMPSEVTGVKKNFLENTDYSREVARSDDSELEEVQKGDTESVVVSTNQSSAIINIVELFLSRAREHSLTLEAALKSGHIQLKDKELVCAFSSSSAYLFVKPHYDFLVRMLKEIAGSDYNLILQGEDDEELESEESEEISQSEESAVSEYESTDKNIERIKDIFRGEIIS